ncbi:hypothetical protein CTI12_AA261150 [Artemisia annua]|uniref:Uncharacterized protein n=1 Tax=Artemisia annua TaxID=35608 RepID=A0A2U1NIP9_ARTAN|nr:hypothetical protein CTI12_AA261150 [Artemisia annua]
MLLNKILDQLHYTESQSDLTFFLTEIVHESVPATTGDINGLIDTVDTRNTTLVSQVETLSAEVKSLNAKVSSLESQLCCTAQSQGTKRSHDDHDVDNHEGERDKRSRVRRQDQVTDISQPTTSKSHTLTEKGKSTNAPKDFEFVVIITETTHDTTSPFHNLDKA